MDSPHNNVEINIIRKHNNASEGFCKCRLVPFLVICVVLLLYLQMTEYFKTTNCYLRKGKFIHIIARKHELKDLPSTATSLPRKRLPGVYTDVTTAPTENTKNLATKQEVLGTEDTQTERQRKLREFCRNKYTSKPRLEFDDTPGHMYYNDRYGVLYCSVPKAACTNWKKIMLILDGKLSNPWRLKKQQVHLQPYKTFSGLKPIQREWRKNMYYSFLFVRHPFERLLSAYRNKLADPYDTSFQRIHGKQILKLFRANLTQTQYKAGKNVTFSEFVKYVISSYGKYGPRRLNEHWQVFSSLCNPCGIKYNFIGKMETLIDDSIAILAELGVDIKFPVNATDKYKVRTQKIMKDYFSTVSKEDLDQLYDIFEEDFEAFGYTLPRYLS